jgi:hypothetical protein
MPGIQKTMKVCATCQYWMGYRDISKNAPFVNYQLKGQCTSVRSPRKGKETSGNDRCNWWYKWSAL